MSERQKTLQLKQFNTDYPVTLTFDKCKSGESQYGEWRLDNKFKLYRDYRGKNGGIGALFVKNNISIKSQKIKLEEPVSDIKDI